MNERCSCAGSELDSAGNDEESLAPRIRARFAAAWGEMAGACSAFEWVALGYLAVSGMIIAAFHKNLAAPALHLALRVAIA